MSNAFSEYLNDLKKCVDLVHTNQGEEVELEEKLWNIIDTVESDDIDALDVDSELDSAISVAETMRDNLQSIIDLLNKTANWD